MPLFPLLGNLIVPVVAGGVYFVMAGYVAYVSPMRQLAIGQITYKAAFWGFIFFGIYLITRPVQILMGPHPMPLIVNNIREFFMIGLFSPAVFVAIISFLYGFDRIKRGFVFTIFALCILLAVIFAAANVYAVGGSEEIFRFGDKIAYDGLWFEPFNPHKKLMPLLFVIRLLSPVTLMILAAILAFHRAKSFPAGSVYSNLPKKFFFMGLAVLVFGFSMLFTGFMLILWKIPNQWWVYYVGAIAAGVLELISLRIPLRDVGPLSDEL